MTKTTTLTPLQRERIKERVRQFHDAGVITRSEAEALELYELYVGLRPSALILGVALTTVRDRLARAKYKIQAHSERSDDGETADADGGAGRGAEAPLRAERAA